MMEAASEAYPQKRRVYYGWVIVATVALASFSQTAGTHPVLSLLVVPITNEFGWSLTVFTGAVTAGTLAGAVTALFVGRVIDRLGGRWLLTGALFLLGLSFVLMAFIQSLWQLYGLQILGRMLTMGVVALTLQSIVPKWFIARRGIAVALAGLGGMIGNAITPLYVQWVIGLADWRTASFVAGVVIWVVSVLPVAVLMRRKPEDMGLLPDGADPSAAQKEGDKKGIPVRTEVSMTLSQVRRTSAFYLLAGAFVIMFLVGPGLIFHMVPYLNGRGLEAGQAVWVLALWSASGALGSLAMGVVSARLGARRSLSLGFGLISLGVVFLQFVNSLPLGLAWGLYMGMMMGGLFNVLYQVTFADYFGRESLGSINGAIWPVQMLTNASGPLVVSAVVTATGSYGLVFWVFAGLVGVCSGLAFFARPPRRAGA